MTAAWAAAVAAAAPLIEAAVREQVAREIEDAAEQLALASGWVCDHVFAGVICHTCDANVQHMRVQVARIARGGAR